LLHLDPTAFGRFETSFLFRGPSLLGCFGGLICITADGFPEEEQLSLLVYTLDDGGKLGAILDFLDDSGANRVDDSVYTLVSKHHFLMVAFNLMSIPGLDELGQVPEDLYSFPFESGVENVPKVDEISNIRVILHDVPSVKPIAAVFLFQGLEENLTLNHLLMDD
jgi:hypothetical protein